MNKCPWCDGIADEYRYPLCHNCGFDLIYHYYDLDRKDILKIEDILNE